MLQHERAEAAPELSRLIGAPPGFIGSKRQGALFAFAESHPQGLILLDEIDKAHPEIQDYFLLLFDKGEALDTRGHRMDFRRHLFAMTANVTAHKALGIGFAAGDQRPAHDHAEELDRSLREHFRREFLARIDRVVPFAPLAIGDYQELFDRRIAALADELRPRHVLDVSGEIRVRLCEQAVDQPDGARGFFGLFERGVATPVLRVARGGAAQGTIHLQWDAGRPVAS